MLPRHRSGASLRAALITIGTATLLLGLSAAPVRAADTTPPSVPTGLTGVPQDNRIVQLSWNASTDNGPGPISYRVFRNGNAIGVRQTALTYTDQPAKTGSFKYQVRAIDAAGNKSALSAAITVQVVNSVGPAPDAPHGLSGVRGPDGAAVLSWSAPATGQSGALSYLVRRDGLPIGMTNKASFVDYRAGLLAKSYGYSVVAVDGSVQRSGPPATVPVEVRPQSFSFAGQLYRYGDRTKPMVALTFDDCYSAANIREIVRILRQHNVGGTFFCTGQSIAASPALYRDMVTSFPLGNHTWSHPNLNNISAEQVLDQLTRTTDAIESATGWGAAAVMRAPYGSANLDTRATIARLGLPVIKWDIDTNDWKSDRTATDVYNAAIKAKNGSIVLMHDKAKTVQALPNIISNLKSKGFKLVNIPELLGLPWHPAQP